MGPAFPTLTESIMTALVTRLLSFLFALVVASLLLFVAIKVVPGTAAGAALGIDATPQAIARFNATHGLDRPVYVQYLEWASNTLHGDFGTSFQNGVDVGPELGRRFLVTLELAGLAFIVANLIAIPLGTWAALRHQRASDSIITTLATLFGAVPSFFLATLLILLLTLRLKLLPPGGYIPFSQDPVANLRLMVMPALSLGIVSSALLVRIMRAAMIEVMSSDFIRTARAKGAPQRIVVLRHAIRNALSTYLNVAAVEFGFLFGSVVVIEDIFRIPGLGSFVLTGILNRDYPVLLASALSITVFVLVVNLIVDVAVQLLDPRVTDKKAA